MQSAGPATPTLLPSAADHALAQRRDECRRVDCLITLPIQLLLRTCSSHSQNTNKHPARHPNACHHPPASSPDRIKPPQPSTPLPYPPRLVLSCTALRTSPTSGILKEVTRAIPHPLSATTCSFADRSSVCSETTSTSTCSPPRRLSSSAREMKSAVRTDRSNPSMLASCGRETSNFRHIARRASRECR